MGRAADLLTHRGQLLDSLSYERVLERGFALVCDAAGHPVTRRAETRPAQRLTLRFADGAVGVSTDREGGPGREGRPAAPIQERLL